MRAEKKAVETESARRKGGGAVGGNDDGGDSGDHGGDGDDDVSEVLSHDNLFSIIERTREVPVAARDVWPAAAD